MQKIYLDGVSVLICTYNGATRIGKTLEFLSKQKTENLAWEIIMVDNASEDNTVEAIKETWSQLNSTIPLHIFEERSKGKDKALDLGISKVDYKYLIICDDDNWLFENYLQTAYRTMQSNPTIGILGGEGIPVFESEPPEWFDNFKSFYAVGKQNSKSGEIELTQDTILFIWGAGAVINMDAYSLLQSLNFNRWLSFDHDPRICRSEDVEFSLAIGMLGHILWYEDDLKFYHFIPEERTKWNYLINLIKSSAMARPYLKHYHYLTCMGYNKVNIRIKWYQYAFVYFKFLISEHRNLKDIFHSIMILFGINKVGDIRLQQKAFIWTEFLTILKLGKKSETIYKRIAHFHNRIIDEFEMIDDYEQENLSETFSYN